MVYKARIKRAPRTEPSGIINVVKKWRCKILGYTFGGSSLRRCSCFATATVLVISILVPSVEHYISLRRYAFSKQTSNLLGPASPTLADKLVFDGTKDSYVFNKEGMEVAPSSSKDPADPTAVLKQMQAQVGGAGKKAKTLYSVELPRDSSKGLTYFDNNLGVHFSMVPEFKQELGGKSEGRLLYPSKNGVQTAYTAKSNGLKEDIILQKPQGDKLVFNYKLKLPASLEARLRPDGSLGIFSADPSLFGNISYGTTKDQAVVEKARQISEKTNLVFAIPAPIIKQTGHAHGDARAEFFLEGKSDILAVKVANLNTIKPQNYPISVDPSVVITSSTDFQSGNNEGSIVYSTSGQITRGELTGGNLSGTWTAQNSLPAVVDQAGTVVSNGYIYVIGGYNGTVNLSTVYYAQILTGGTLSAWGTTTAPLPSIMTRMGAVAYNGYIYSLGGYNSATTTSVYYGKAAANGNISSWNTGTPLPAATQSMFATAYHGYVYLLNGNSGSAGYKTAYYAAINADGSIGSWIPTTNSTVANGNTVAFANNGYIYSVGGYNGTSVVATVNKIPINSDGSLGTWGTTTPYPVALENISVGVYDGYIYAMAGDAGAAGNANVRYAPIYANGDIGSWTTTKSIPVAKTFNMVAMSGGYIYEMGGITPSFVATVNMNSVLPAGSITPFATSANAPATARAFAATVANNGYLYAIGGCSAISGDTCSTASTLVSYAAIGANGVLGAWANATTALPAARAMGSAFAYNGSIFYVAGRPTSTTVSPTIYYAAIGASGNITAAWTTIAAPTGLTARYGQASVIYNGYFYVIGGCETASGACTVYDSDVQYAVIDTVFGGFATNPSCANTFCPLTSITTGRWGHGAVLHGNVIYISGGLASGGAQSDVQYATIASNGTLSTWSTATTGFTTARYGHVFGEANGVLYVSAGKTGTAAVVATTYFARISSSGDLAADSGCGTTWCADTAVPVARGGSVGVVYQATLYEAMGQTTNTAVVTVTYTGAINNGGPGTTGTWATSTNTYTQGRTDTAAVAYNGYLYLLGGEYYVAGPGNTYLATVQFAQIKSDGTLGVWASTTALPETRIYHTAEVYNGYIYVIGGEKAFNTVPTNEVLKATLDPSTGAVGSWTSAGTDAAAQRYDHATAVLGDHVYIIGGVDYAGTTIGTVSYAIFQSGGNLSAWTSTTALPDVSKYPGALIYNNYLYVFGGYNTAGNDTARVMFAPIDGAGNVGTWNFTTEFIGARVHPIVTAYNGFLYLASGDSNAGTAHADVQFAPIFANGTVGAWSNTNAITSARAFGTGTLYHGKWYILSGDTGTTYFSDTLIAPLTSIPRYAEYSKLIDLGANTTISDINYNGSLPGGKASITYSLADSTGVFGAKQSASGLTGACILGGTTRYVMTYLILDDTGDAVYLDSNQASVTDLTVNFSTGGGVLPAQRLHGGKTLQSTSTLKPLDTEKLYPGSPTCA